MQWDVTILGTLSQNALLICNSCVIKTDIFSFCSLNLSSQCLPKYFPNSSSFTGVFILSRKDKTLKLGLLLFLPESIAKALGGCYSFLSLEVSGCDCLPDRCSGKSAVYFLDSALGGNLQLLTFLAN